MKLSDTIIVLIMSALEFYYFFKSVALSCSFRAGFFNILLACVTTMGLFGRSPRLTCLIVYVILLTWGIRVTE